MMEGDLPERRSPHREIILEKTKIKIYIRCYKKVIIKTL